MATNIVQMTDGTGNKQYPVTSAEAVGMPDGSGNLTNYLDKRVTEYNVSVLHPTSGSGGSNKYTLETAIAQVPSKYRSVGLKCAFINESGKPECWKYQGSSWVAASFTKEADGGNKILGWVTDAATTRKQVALSERKSLLQISYRNADGDIVNEQYIGTTFTDTEWGNDSNWEKITNNKGIMQASNNALLASLGLSVSTDSLDKLFEDNSLLGNENYVNDIGIAVPSNYQNYNSSNLLTIPKNPLGIKGVITKFKAFVNNQQINRTLNFLLLLKSEDRFDVIYQSGDILAENSGMFEYAVNIAVNDNIYVGCICKTSNKSNSIGFLGTGGNTYTEWGGYLLIDKPEEISNLSTKGYILISQLTDETKGNRCFPPCVEIDVYSDLISPTTKEVFNNGEPEKFVINDLDSHDKNIDKFPVRKYLFIPALGEVKEDGYLGEFSCMFDENTIGQGTFNFVVLKPNEDKTQFEVTYVSEDIEITDTTISYLPKLIFKVLKGNFIGVYVKNLTNTTNKGLSFYNSGGPTFDDWGGWSKSISDISVGLNISSPEIQPKNRGFIIQAIMYNRPLVLQSDKNVKNGIVGIDENKQYSSDITRIDDWWVGKSVVWIGTSIPARGGDNSYPLQVGRYLNCKMDNQAVGESGIIWNGSRAKSLSATVEELSGAFPGQEDQSYERKLLGKTIDYLIIDHGYNDRKDVSLDVDIESEDRATFYGAVNYVIAKVREENPLVRLMFITPPDNYDASNGAHNVKEIGKLREAIKKLAELYNAPFIDLSIICNNNRFNYQLQSDQVHPDQNLTDKIAWTLAQHIKLYS